MANVSDTLNALRSHAMDDCLAHARQVLGEPLAVEIDDSKAAWSPHWLRYILEQRMTIYRPLADVEVILDDSQQVAGFIDHGAPSPSEWRELCDEDILAAVVSTGLVPEEAVLQSRRRAPDGSLEVRLSSPGTQPLLARIDPGLRRVMALEPLPETQP